MFRNCRPCILMKPGVKVPFPTHSYKLGFAFVFISVATTDDLCTPVYEQIQPAFGLWTVWTWDFAHFLKQKPVER